MISETGVADMDLLRRLYLRIGLHAAPPDTLLGGLHRILIRVFGKGEAPEEPLFDRHWYKIVHLNGTVFHRFPGPHFRETLRPTDQVRFDLRYAIETYQPPYIGLVFFMGLGDYLFITPFLRQLRRSVPETKLIAFVPRRSDKNNNRLVADLLSVDPSIDEVRTFDGARSAASAIDWRNYDIRHALASADPAAVMLPVFYEYDMDARLRAIASCRMFGLPVPDLDLPVLPDLPPPSEAATALIERVCEAADDMHRPVVFLHLENRSGNFTYRHASELCGLLLDRGCVVVHVTGEPGMVPEHPHYVEIDVHTVPIFDSFAILIALHRLFSGRLSMIALPSVFAAASSALGLPCLQVQHRYDHALSSIWYPNITVLTHRDLPAIPVSHIVLAERGRFVQDSAHFVTIDTNLIAETWERWCGSVLIRN